MDQYRFYAGGPKKDSTDYVYDALDRTVKETETHDEWSGTTRTTKFSYQGLSDLVTEERISGKNPTTKTYSYDAFGHRISLTNDPDDPAKETKTYTYGYDVHGSVSQLITQGGQVQASYGYTPYGGEDTELTKGDNASATLEPLNSYRYTGARMDTGMDRGQEEQDDSRSDEGVVDLFDHHGALRVRQTPPRGRVWLSLVIHLGYHQRVARRGSTPRGQSPFLRPLRSPYQLHRSRRCI